VSAAPLAPAGAPAPRQLPARTAPAGRRRVRALLIALVATAAVVALLRALVVSPYTVGSDSMRPTVPAGATVLVDKISHRWAGVSRDDLIVFSSEQGSALKRVVGVGGDRIAIRDGVLDVNDRVVPEPYVDHARVDGLYFGPVTVPAGHVFVLGDNRDGSIDSRVYGPVPLGDVRGRVLLRLP
jgi:signal peptidase I